ncbi:MAG: HNH endonuclease [Burkholderiales bacterium]|nr:HNH endonuclease [Burkholderiales bacterium]
MPILVRRKDEFQFDDRLVSHPMPAVVRRSWLRQELLLVLHLYWRIPFGQQDARNARVIELASALGRSPGSVSMKLNNMTSLDPEELARGVRGLPGASALDRLTWAEFKADQEAIGAEAEAAWRLRVEHQDDRPAEEIVDDTFTNLRLPPQRIETTAIRRVRLGQAFFRRAVLDNFEGRCALTGLGHLDLINASHIVGWAEDEAHRVDPRNGIALNRLHDAAFDKKLVTFDEDLRLVIGRTLREFVGKDELARSFIAFEGRPLRKSARHNLDPILLARHREAFAKSNA